MSKRYEECAIRKNYEELTQFLIENNLSITTMESATSGQIASLITDTEGASAIFKGAFITYSNEAKIMQGVPADIIDTYSVYSLETAKAMAESCRRTYTADIGIGVTGTMGNVDPQNADASQVGMVYFAIALKQATECFHVEIAPQPTRLAYKLAAAKEIYDALKVMIEKKKAITDW